MNTRSYSLSEKLGRVAVGLALALCASLVPLAAGAQARAGLPLEGLAPEGHVVARVLAPDSVDAPVRVALSSAQGAHSFTIDVWVRDSSSAARALCTDAAPTLSSEGVERLAGLGDLAWRGGARVVAFARYNVFVIVTASDGADAAALATRLDAQITRAPASATSPRHLDRSLPSAVGSRTVAMPGDVAAMNVVVSSGPASARRVPGGWMLTREGPGEARISAIVVDAFLRARVSSAPR